MANGHATLAPSGAKKWMACAGSPAMEAGEPNTTSKYSAEGTAAHFLADLCLKTNVPAVQSIGMRIVVDADGAAFSTFAGTHQFSFIVDEPLAAFVQKYVDKVLEYVGTDGLAFFENRMSISSITGEADAFGTADAVVVLPGELQVHDLKFGMGISVPATENAQLMIYALAALPIYEQNRSSYSALGPLKTIRLVIHQPRVNSFPEWSCTLAELMAFGERVKEAGELSLSLLLITHADVEGNLTPGDHCSSGFCKARATCPALAKKVQDEVGVDFESLIDKAPAVGASLGQKMAAISNIEAWCKAVRAKVESELLLGRPVAGYKLVKGRKGARAWDDVGVVDGMLKAMKLTEAERYKQTLKSPTQLQALMIESPGSLGPTQWKKIQAHVTQSAGSPSVAEASDPREALAIDPLDADFGAVATDADFADMCS